MAKILDGKIVAEQIQDEIKERIKDLKKKNTVPGLSVVLVGDDPASKVYVNMKEKACEKLGINSYPVRLPKNKLPFTKTGG